MPTAAVPPGATSRRPARQTPSWGHIKTAGLIALGLLAAFDFLPKLNDPAPPPLVSLLFLAVVDGLIALVFAAIIGLRSIPFEGDGFWPLLALVVGVRAVAVLIDSGFGAPQAPAVISLSAAAPLLLVGAVALFHLVAKHTTDLTDLGERTFNQNRTERDQ